MPGAFGHSTAVSTSDLVPGPQGNSEAWESQTLADLPFRGFETSTGEETATFAKWVTGIRNPHSVPFLKSLGEFLFWMNMPLPLSRGCHIWPATKLCVQLWWWGWGWHKDPRGPPPEHCGQGGPYRISRDAVVAYTHFVVKSSVYSLSAHDAVHE